LPKVQTDERSAGVKGVIVQCLAELVKEKFGRDKWEEALEKSGLDKDAVFLATQDVEDNAVLKVVGSVCETLGISLVQAADAFGEYWVNTFAPKIYATYYRGADSARDFLLKMDDVHRAATKSIPGAHPPRFEYEWKDDKTLVMTYKSHRGLIDFLVGLIKGVGTYFKEDLQVTKLSDEKVEVVFPG
jgi:hypothetical protein